MEKPKNDDPDLVPAMFKMMAAPGTELTDRAKRILTDTTTPEPKKPKKRQGDLRF